MKKAKGGIDVNSYVGRLVQKNVGYIINKDELCMQLARVLPK